MIGLVKKLFGTVNDRLVEEFNQICHQVNSLEEKYQKLSDSELKEQTFILKDQYKSGKTLDQILPDAYALCREASLRVLSMRHFDVQIMGGIALHRGMIAEMGTGEGKTLAATLPAYLNALTGNPVHIITVNDYLASRDSVWMGKIYQFLGLSVGCITGSLSEKERQDAYQSDITYGTNNEFGFDYLRDNLKLETKNFAQRGLEFAIIDEVDSILIDEARTPLVISGPAEDSSKLYRSITALIPKLSKDSYEIDEKTKTAMLTDIGTDEIEELCKKVGVLEAGTSLYDIENIALVHHINQALKAYHLFHNDVDYLINDGQIMIIDEFTGRAMEGRRFSDGLHQALEAKENVEIQKENQTLASITFQNYFRHYKKLSGMTGTALTEAEEFSSIYNLEVVTIPTHMKDARIDHEDVIYKNVVQKYNAIIEQIKICHAKKQPVLVGTISIEKSELISRLLKKHKISHNILNAKQHHKEANIIAQAGRAGSVTIATNMAGRGTDIMLGGNPEMLLADNPKLSLDEIKQQVDLEKQEIIAQGGLYIIGTERHESRRIDNQLRGRSARQGDKGETQFFLSLEDDLMRIFGSDKIKTLLEKLGLKDDESIHHPWISRALEKAQKKVEAHNFEIRKSLIKYDDVLNEQRNIIYAKRREVLSADSVSGTIEDFIQTINENLVAQNIPAKSYIEKWNLKGLDMELHDIYGHLFNIEGFVQNSDISEADILTKINYEITVFFKEKHLQYDVDTKKELEKNLFVLTLDNLWKNHLNLMEHLKVGIHLRAYGQKDPLNEYKKEAFEMFEEMLDNLMIKLVQRLAHIELRDNSDDFIKKNLNAPQVMINHKSNNNILDISANNKNVAPEDRIASDPTSWGKVGRNELCPCGSGKKYKQCHGRIK
jgi:preprotein translocase subunit SecA